jgi:hypothetical protein
MHEVRRLSQGGRAADKLVRASSHLQSAKQEGHIGAEGTFVDVRLIQNQQLQLLQELRSYSA